MTPPRRFLEKLRAGEDPAAVFNDLARAAWLPSLLDNITSLEAYLKAGLNPNSVWAGWPNSREEWPILATTMLLNQPHAHEALVVLTEYGADWGALIPVAIGRWPNEHSIRVPVAHAVMYHMQGSTYWARIAIRKCGLDPNLVDPVWGGNLAHHAISEPLGPPAIHSLGEAGMDLNYVARGDEAAVAWAKLTGEWIPEWHGLSANEYYKVWEQKR